ncbi:dephospho-CoA kinase [Pararhodospirillum photometricum]|nr:dephospho-CoA kinase [Pararhodospirillum photometricum]
MSLALQERLARRARGRRPWVLGLTGSIGMGKTTAARMARCRGVPVHNADATVHQVLAPGGAAVAAVLAAFPGVGDGQGGIDRRALGARVFGDPEALRRLEGLLHPRVRAVERAFLARHTRERRRVVVLDVPLLFETGGERRCDWVAVVWAPPFLRAQRVLARPGLTRERLHQIIGLQTREPYKKLHADALLPSGLGREPAWRALGRVLRAKQRRSLAPRAGRFYPHA